VGKSIALAYVPAPLVRPAGDFEVEILGERRRAALAEHPLYDPRGDRLRLD
jgi:dimethylglycine dehydrogenase